MCGDQACILNVYVCDGYTDCVDSDDDETVCARKDYQLINYDMTCNPFYVRDYTVGESCFPIHTAANNVLLDLTTQYTQYHTEHNMPIQHLVPCTSSSDQVYQMSKTCMFERDIYGNPVHCSNTEHLQFCPDHVCPGK